MKTSKAVEFIVDWIKKYKETNRINGFVVGVSGGVDSALTSTLCAMTGIKTLCINMPIRQKKEQYLRANNHINWLKDKFKNVNSLDLDLTNVFNEFKSSVENNSQVNNLALANSRSRKGTLDSILLAIVDLSTFSKKVSFNTNLLSAKKSAWVISFLFKNLSYAFLYSLNGK